MNLLKPSFVTVCSLGVLVRVVFLAYGEWQDANMQVKYTDVDYKVFTDAARLVTQGRSPYARATYRYTPLLAFLLTPNIYIHPVFGKLLFVLADLLVGYLICQLLLLRGLGKEKAVLLTGATWLLNPMVAAISTRGNAESLLGAMILLTIYWILTKLFVSASLLYGISVHFKLYPIIYAIPLVILLDDEDYSGHRRKGKEKAYPRWSRQYWNRQITMFVTPTRIRFALLSGGIFFILNAFMYYLYSQEFLKETYLYHVTRRDHRHNFSLWFYYIYLNYHSQTRLPWLGWQGFLQLGSVTLLGSVFGKDIFFALFVQTFAFVTYNRVCTSQYFMWYICLFPLIIPSTTLTFKYRGFLMILAWVGSQGLWLYQAYQLEFLGENTFFGTWLASVLFFSVNIWILTELIKNHEYDSVFELGQIKKVWEKWPSKKNKEQGGDPNYMKDI